MNTDVRGHAAARERGGVRHRGERAAGKAQGGRERILGLDVVPERIPEPGDLDDRLAHQPEQQVQVVDPLVHETAPVEADRSPPAGAPVILRGAVVLADEVGKHDLAELPVLEQLPELAVDRLGTALEHAAELDSGLLHRRNSSVELRVRDAERLLAEDMLAGLRRRNHPVAVSTARRADAHHVNVVPREKGINIIRGKRDVQFGLALLGPVQDQVIQPDDLGTSIVRSHAVDVAGGNNSTANDAPAIALHHAIAPLRLDFPGTCAARSPAVHTTP